MKYNKLATTTVLNKTAKSLREKGYQLFTVDDSVSALNKIRSLIPSGATVMNGASVTLEQIGFVDFLKTNKHKWIDLHAKINAENDPLKRDKLRKQSALSDYYLGSVHALIENGDFLVASNTGSQLPQIVYTSPNLIFVVSTKKIVPDLKEAFSRLEKYVLPLENEHMQKLYNMPSNISKIIIFRKEQPFLNRKITFILVKEDLGF